MYQDDYERRHFYIFLTIHERRQYIILVGTKKES